MCVHASRKIVKDAPLTFEREAIQNTHAALNHVAPSLVSPSIHRTVRSCLFSPHGWKRVYGWKKKPQGRSGCHKHKICVNLALIFSPRMRFLGWLYVGQIVLLDNGFVGICTVFEGYTLSFRPCPTHMSTVSSRCWSICQCVGVLESAGICQYLGDCVCVSVCWCVRECVCLSVCGRECQCVLVS